MALVSMTEATQTCSPLHVFAGCRGIRYAHLWISVEIAFQTVSEVICGHTVVIAGDYQHMDLGDLPQSLHRLHHHIADMVKRFVEASISAYCGSGCGFVLWVVCVKQIVASNQKNLFHVINCCACNQSL